MPLSIILFLVMVGVVDSYIFITLKRFKKLRRQKEGVFFANNKSSCTDLP